MDILYKNITIGALKDITIYENTYNVNGDACISGEINGFFKSARFDKNKLTNIISITTPVDMRRCLCAHSFSVLIKNKILVNLRITLFTGRMTFMHYNSEEFIIISEPSSSILDDGKTYWKADDLIDVEDYNLYNLCK